MSAPVVEPAQVAAIAQSIAEATLVAFDLEFLSSDRLVPALCLIQVAWLPGHVRLDVPAAAIVATPPEVALVDPQAVDVTPIVHAIAAHPCAVVHAGRQDLGLLATRFGVAMPNIIDTQVMAAFAGIGDQVGLATLAQELLGTTLGKELQWTDWSRRPLSDAQLAYADADVRHLPAMFALLVARLGERFAWARAESSVVAAEAATASAMTALAAWRQRVAVELDRPLGQVLNDKALVDMARARPTTGDGVRGTKNLSPLARQRAAEIAEAIATAPPVETTGPNRWRAPSARAQRWTDALLAIVAHQAETLGLAARLLATRADVEELARVVDEEGLAAAQALPALATWRRDVIGTRFVEWFEGRLAIAGDLASPSGVKLI